MSFYQTTHKMAVLFRISSLQNQCVFYAVLTQWCPQMKTKVAQDNLPLIKYYSQIENSMEMCNTVCSSTKKKKNYLLSWSWDWDPPLQTEFIEFRWRIRSNWPSLGQVTRVHLARPKMALFEGIWDSAQNSPVASRGAWSASCRFSNPF